ncbi:hypothetical protein TNCV_4156761 [Trichonephila clavipes]|nr:hypothetical protein TNCV_4156761 [Trichonephila clavipes]
MKNSWIDLKKGNPFSTIKHGGGGIMFGNALEVFWLNESILAEEILLPEWSVSHNSAAMHVEALLGCLKHGDCENLTSFPEDTSMPYSGFEPEPTRLQAQCHNHYTSWAAKELCYPDVATRATES